MLTPKSAVVGGLNNVILVSLAHYIRLKTLQGKLQPAKPNELHHWPSLQMHTLYYKYPKAAKSIPSDYHLISNHLRQKSYTSHHL